jgi:hypothetical protein
MTTPASDLGVNEELAQQLQADAITFRNAAQAIVRRWEFLADRVDKDTPFYEAYGLLYSPAAAYFGQVDLAEHDYDSDPRLIAARRGA